MGEPNNARTGALTVSKRLLAILFLLFATTPFNAYWLGLPSRSATGTNEQAYSRLLSSSVQMAALINAETSQDVAPPIFNNIQVTSDPSNLPQNEPSITVNPSNPSNLAAGANDYRLVSTGNQAWTGVYSSFDGGFTWSNRLIPGFPGDPLGSLLSGFDAAADPALAFNRNGTLHYAGIVFNFQANSVVDGSVFVATSYDGGVTFNQTTIVAEGSRRIFNDKEYIAVDNSLGPFRGRIYASWTMFTATTGDIMVASSGDGGRTFSAAVKVSTSPVNQGSLPVVGPSGELYVVWSDLSNERIMVAKSTNGGGSFSVPVQISNYVPLPSPLPGSLFRVNNNPTAAVDDTNGDVYAAWSDYRNGNADILFSRSSSGGSTWSLPAKVNDDATTNDQFFPWMTVSQGTISLDFYDRRLDPSNHFIDVFVTQSTNGGTSFTPNLRVTAQSSNPDAVIFSGGQSFIGDYIGIASTSTTLFPAWTDLRNVGPGSSQNQDIFTATIQNHDIAVTLLIPSRSVVYEGISTNPVILTATIENFGIYTETSVTVRFVSNGTLLGLATLTSISPGARANVTINWDTNTLPKGGYVLSAEVFPLTGEVETSNNLYEGIIVEVRFPGDLDGDRDVDIVDIATIALAFDSVPGSLNWNPDADVDNDDSVTIVDVSMGAFNFGRIDP